MEPQQSLSGRVVSRIVGNVCRIRLSVALLVLVGAAPAAAMFYLVTHYWVPLPYWDEWATPGKMFASWCNGTLTLPDLVSQHNESRKFFPRLLYLALAVAGGWDVRKEMLVCFATVCAIALLFYRLMRQTPGATALSAAIGWTAATFLCFSAVQLDNFLWGIQLEPFFPGLAVLAIAVVNTSERSLARKSLLNATLALIATYTFANGMLLWAIGVPHAVAARQSRDSKCVCRMEAMRSRPRSRSARTSSTTNDRLITHSSWPTAPRSCLCSTTSCSGLVPTSRLLA